MHLSPFAHPGLEAVLPRTRKVPGIRGAAPALAFAFAILSLACGGKDGGDSTPATGNAPPPILVQPLDQVLTSGQTATFGVVAAGPAALSYQWSKNGTALSGATAAAYTTPSLTTADSGASFTVAVTSGAGAVTSRPAILTVVAAGNVTTFAGTAGSVGSADGTGGAARFLAPFGVAADVSGILYVADSGNHTIRRIDAGGGVTTFAGTAGMAGSADANGASARFNQPTGVAADGSGNLYVSDSGNRTIRKITPLGDVTTLAGAPGVYGSADGTGAGASFAFPQGLAVDGAGNVFVCDAYNNTIRKISAGGAVTTLAGTAGTIGSADGTGAAASFRQPMGLALDGAGNLYVADTGNHVIRKVAPGGVVTTLAGKAGNPGLLDGTGTAAKLWSPTGLALDASGNLLVADTDNRCIRKVTPAGIVTTQAGSPLAAGSADGVGSMASFGQPTGLAVTSAGIFIADATYNTIRKLVPGS